MSAISSTAGLPPPAAARPAARATQPANGLGTDEQRVVADLQRRDLEVRAHEMAHVGAGGGVVTGGPTYSFQRGPDGQLYAVGGEVQIDTSPGRSPEETIDRARRIRSAALAPAEPSAQDRQVAAAATRMEIEARAELAEAVTEERTAPSTSTADRSDPEGAATERNRADLARLFGAVAVSPVPGNLISTFA